MSKFEAGKRYFTRFAGDADQKIFLTIASRTDKTVKTPEGRTLRVKERDGVEFVYPMGRYSMCPVIHADRVAA